MATRKALKSESNDESVEFTFRGLTLSIPVGKSMSIDALEAFEENKLAKFVSLSLGAEQWDSVKKSGSFTVGDLGDLVAAMTEAMGTSQGESKR